MHKRSLLFLAIPILALALVVMLLYSVRSAQPSPGATASNTGSTPAVQPVTDALPPPAASLPAKAPPVGAPADAQPADPTPTMPTAAPAQDGDVIAVVAGQALTRSRFALVQAVDDVMSGLLGMAPASPDALLEQMINHALVAQQMGAEDAAPAMDSAARLAELLAASGKGEDDLAAALAATGVQRVEFDRYFAELLAVQAFARQSAEDRGGDMDAYIAALQAGAHISYGPAAAAVRQEAAREETASSAAPTADDSSAGAASPGEAVAGGASASGITATTAVTGTAEARGLAAGQLAPDFTLPVLGRQQEQAAFASLLGKPTVLSFWTTWCPYCLRQTPILVAAAEQHAQAVRFVGIDVAEEAAAVTAYVEEHGIPYTVLLDQDSQAAAAYGVEGYPTTYFLDSTGHIVAHHIGALTEEQLAQYIKQLLAT